MDRRDLVTDHLAADLVDREAQLVEALDDSRVYAEMLVEAQTELRWFRDYAAALLEFSHWLIERQCRRDSAAFREVLAEWHAELDERHRRARAVADREGRAA
jgi:hypothetical protein